MTGSLDNFECKIAQIKGVPRRYRSAVIKIECLAVINCSAGFGGQLQRSDHVIFIAVGFENVGDGHAVAGGDFRINFTIPAWIDDRRAPTMPDDVGQMRKSFRLNFLKNHVHGSTLLLLRIDIPVAMFVCITWPMVTSYSAKSILLILYFTRKIPVDEEDWN